MTRFHLFMLLQVLSISLALEPGIGMTKELETLTSMKSFIELHEIPEHIFPTTILLEISMERILKYFQEYIDHLKERGKDVVKNIMKQITKDINSNKNITKDVASAIDNYEKKIENYATENYITILNSQLVVDKVYMFLDVLNTAYRYILREQRKYFDDLASETNNTKINNSTNGTAKVHIIIFTQTLQFKKEELLYLCNHHQICKPYSAFSLHFQSFISEVLSLENYAFKSFVELLNELINTDEDFVDFMNANDNIIKNISSVFASPANIKESLEVLRALLIHRYKIIHITNLKRKRKIQAVRTILDDLEMVLSFDYEKQFDMNFTVAINAVKTWTKAGMFEREDECADDISDFINSIFKALYRSGDYFIPNLIETILTGKITEQEEYKDLFRDGSKNVFAAEESF